MAYRPYHPLRLGLSRPQVVSLSRGKGVIVKVKGMKPSSHVHFLTMDQLMKLKSSILKGKGMRLNFSQHQVRHNLVNGGGWWQKLKDILRKIARPGLTAGSKYLVENYLDEQHHDKAHALSKAGVEKLGKQYGFGVRKRRIVGYRRKRLGGSFRVIGGKRGGSFRTIGSSRRGGSFSAI